MQDKTLFTHKVLCNSKFGFNSLIEIITLLILYSLWDPLISTDQRKDGKKKETRQMVIMEHA